MEGLAITASPMHDNGGTSMQALEVSILAAGVGAMMFIGSIAEAECFCGENGFDYQAADPRDTDFMEDFLWAVQSVAPVYDLRKPDEPVDYCLVRVEMVHEHHAAIDTFSYEDWGDETPIFYLGSWMTHEEFESTLRETLCLPALS